MKRPSLEELAAEKHSIETTLCDRQRQRTAYFTWHCFYLFATGILTGMVIQEIKNNKPFLLTSFTDTCLFFVAYKNYRGLRDADMLYCATERLLEK